MHAFALLCNLLSSQWVAAAQPNPDAGLSAGGDKWSALLSREWVFLKELKDNAVRVEGEKSWVFFFVHICGMVSFSLAHTKRSQKINKKSQPYAKFQGNAVLG